MKTEIYVSEGKTYKVKSLMIGSELWLHVNGNTYVLDQRPKSHRAASAAGHTAEDQGILLAPMPGKILKLNCMVGESIPANKLLVVMEAMKMEYSLSAPFAGKVTEVLCAENQQVELNQKLVTIVPEEGAQS